MATQRNPKSDQVPKSAQPDSFSNVDDPEERKNVKRLRADKPAQALHSQWAQEDANRTASQREADRDRWRDV